MKNVSLIGNVTFDEIIDVCSMVPGRNHVCPPSRFQAGGLMNMLPALDRVKVSLYSNIGTDHDLARMVSESRFKLNECTLAKRGQSTIAHILVDKTNCSRTSFVNWADGKDMTGLLPDKSHWTHISYLDVLENLDIKAIRKRSKILSADLCLNQPTDEQMSKVLKSLRYLDFLFMSPAELRPYIQDLENRWYTTDMAKRMNGYVIMHTAADTTIVYPDGHTTVRAPEPEKDLDTLGAGDLYAASFINFILSKDSTIRQAAEMAHAHTLKILRSRK